MPTALERAEQQFQDGQYKKAVDTLWEVGDRGDASPEEARRLLELATLLCERTQGRLRHECEEHLSRAQRMHSGAEQRQQLERVRRLETELADPLALAQWAKQAGLPWFEIASAEDVVAADQAAAVAASAQGQPRPAPRCFIGAVEAQGWRLEQVTYRFKPTKVQTSALRGADLVMGGDRVEGEESYLYLFRAVDEESG